ncbi:hybrid sensor histidine kinase/response regulator [Minwuia thermotolerans]|uniref:Chemotaxis protein CheA n=1 Tax=Minwuia thermotolerans TaxID=2056226 RepID=A0A2M9G2D9_9PROT|nr:hybrid sensor histidine kinase/response regulator [Minwuia thermotolerans]PJK29878.1 hybrid sensor histidine kinase/response regulator [Minwuia thermotolerans]
MDELISEFIEETLEQLSEIEQDLVHLEQEPNQPGTIDQLFRVVHTIKGTCSFINLHRLGTVAHAAENVLGLVREKSLEPTPDVISAVLEAMDQIQRLLDEIQATGEEPDVDVSVLIAKLETFVDAPQATISNEDDFADTAAAEAEEPIALVETAENDAAESEPGDNPLFATLAEILQGAGGDDDDAEDDAPVAEAAPEPAAPAAPEPAAPAAAAPAAPVAEDEEEAEETSARNSSAPRAATQGLRVSVELLEQLMNLVSELVLTRNQLLQLVRGQSDSVFHLPLQRLSQVTSELQEGVMKTRMQPIGNAWNKLPRIVRDLGLELGKKIELHMEGAETELDRQVLDMIKDPLTHMVRNSADHGIESREARKAAGKAETGNIYLSARHEGGHIVIELRDDGAGLNAEAIRRRIVERGLVSAGEAEGMNSQRLHQFIFAPGFSTAETVSAVSGRGVGMDVVRTNIEKIGGSIDLHSAPGQGTDLIIKIPLTLAIVSALIVESAGERFAIPQISVQELVRVNGTAEQQIEEIDGACLLRLRERLLPLLYLGEVLKLNDKGLHDVLERKELFVVVAQIGSQQFGIIVDKVFDTEEIVVKPVAPILRDIRMFSGNTILGDGSVIMILDPNGLATTMSAKQVEQDDRDDAAALAAAQRKIDLLIFEMQDETPKAVPLSLVDRLEEFEAARIETIDRRKVVQYRNALMPIVGMDCQLPDIRERQQVIVFSDHQSHLGLAVDRIVDIGAAEISVDLDAMGEGCLGTAIVGGRAMEVLDVSHYLRKAYPDRFGENQKPYEGEEPAYAWELLLVDDSAFFRNIVGPLLRSHGYHLTVAEHPDQVLELLDNGARYDVIVSDIEMPGMDGYKLLQELKRHPQSSGTPVIALSSHSTEADRQRGRQAGFHAYIAKLDKNNLIAAIDEAMKKQEIAA